MECCKIENKCLINVLAIALFVVFVSLAVWINVNIADKVRETENTITVSGTGTIYAKPDLGLITASVITEAKTVADAMQENTEKMNAIIAAVKVEGVEDKDLKTTSFNIYPRYEYQKVETEIYPYPPGKRVLVGYEVSQSLQVKIRNLEKIGSIIQVATDAGANEVSDLQLTIDKEDELKAQAREEAIQKAKAKAEELAEQLGIKLIRISNFSESGIMPYFYSMKEALPSGLGGGGTPDIQTGEDKIEVTVSITYEIR